MWLVKDPGALAYRAPLCPLYSQRLCSSAEDAQITTIHEHPAALLSGDLTHDAEVLQMLDRLRDRRRRDGQLLRRRRNPDDRLLLQELVDPKRRCRRATESPDSLPISLEQTEDLAGCFCRLQRRLGDAAFVTAAIWASIIPI